MAQRPNAPAPMVSLAKLLSCPTVALLLELRDRELSLGQAQRMGFTLGEWIAAEAELTAGGVIRVQRWKQGASTLGEVSLTRHGRELAELLVPAAEKAAAVKLDRKVRQKVLKQPPRTTRTIRRRVLQALVDHGELHMTAIPSKTGLHLEVVHEALELLYENGFAHREGGKWKPLPSGTRILSAKG